MERQPPTLDQIISMNKVSRFPYLGSYGHPSLGSLVGYYESALQRQARRHTRSRRKQVLIIAGLPGSGKTHYSQIIEHYMASALPEPHMITRLSWEEDGRKRIKRPLHELANRAELHQANILVAERISEAARNPELAGMVIELPVLPAIDIASKVHGKNWGFEAALWLSRGMHMFEDIRNIDVWFAGLMGGSLLRYVKIPERTDLKKARSFEQAKDLADIYGVPDFDEQKWHQYQSSGANEKQVVTAEAVVAHIADLLPSQGVPVELPTNQLFRLTAESEGALKFIGLSREFGVYRRWATEGTLLKSVIQENLAIHKNMAFAGYNTIPLKSLNLRTQEEFDRLSQYLDSRPEIEPPPPSTLHRDFPLFWEGETNHSLII
jgi:hypothetical protein